VPQWENEVVCGGERSWGRGVGEGEEEEGGAAKQAEKFVALRMKGGSYVPFHFIPLE